MRRLGSIKNPGNYIRLGGHGPSIFDQAGLCGDVLVDLVSKEDLDSLQAETSVLYELLEKMVKPGWNHFSHCRFCGADDYEDHSYTLCGREGDVEIKKEDCPFIRAIALLKKHTGKIPRYYDDDEMKRSQIDCAPVDPARYIQGDYKPEDADPYVVEASAVDFSCHHKLVQLVDNDAKINGVSVSFCPECNFRVEVEDVMMPGDNKYTKQLLFWSRKSRT